MPRDRHCTDRSRRYISPISECFSSDDNYYPTVYNGLRRTGNVRSRSLSRSISRSSSISPSRARRISSMDYPREEGFYRDSHLEYSTYNQYSNGLRPEKGYYYDTHSPSQSPSPVAHYPGLSHPRVEYWPSSGRSWSREERSFRYEPRWEDRHSSRSPGRYFNYQRHEDSPPIERNRYPSQQPRSPVRSPVRYPSRFRSRGFSERRFSRHRAPWDSPPPLNRQRQSFSREDNRVRRFYNSPLRRTPQRSPPWADASTREKSYRSEHLRPKSPLALRKKGLPKSADKEANRNISKNNSKNNSTEISSQPPVSNLPVTSSHLSPSQSGLESEKLKNTEETDIPAAFNILWPYVSVPSRSNTTTSDEANKPSNSTPSSQNEEEKTVDISPNLSNGDSANNRCPTLINNHDRSNTFPPLISSGNFVPFPNQDHWSASQINPRIPLHNSIHSGLPQPGQFMPHFIPPLPPFVMPRPWVSHMPYRPSRSLQVNPNLRFYNNSSNYQSHPYNIPPRHLSSTPRPYNPSPVSSQPEALGPASKDSPISPASTQPVPVSCTKPADHSVIQPQASSALVNRPVENMLHLSEANQSSSTINENTMTNSNSTSKNPYSVSLSKSIEAKDSFPSLEPIQRLLKFSNDKPVSSSKALTSTNNSRRPSFNTFPFISKPDFLVQYEDGLYPHPWPSKLDEEASERKAELLRLRAAESRLRFQLERSKFGLVLSQLEVSRIECSLSASE